MPRALRFSHILSLALVILVVFIVRNQYLFETFLDYSSISLLDFPQTYRTALDNSLQDNTVLEYDYALFARAESTFSIPATVHFIWFKDLYSTHLHRADHETEIAHVGSDAPLSCQWNSPGFEVMIWNATAARDLLSTNYPDFLQTYDSYQYPIQRVDAFKYFLLYHHGGIYMDLDISCRRPLWPLLQYPAWFPKADWRGVNNDVFAASKGHPLLKRMTERLQSRDRKWLFPYLTVYWSTGPSFVSDVLAEWWSEKQGAQSRESPDSFFILPRLLYTETSPYFGHRTGGTWHGDDVAVVLWLLDRPWLIVLLIVMLAGLFAIIATSRMRRHACISFG